MAYAQKGLKNILQKYPKDVVFLSALRTPITRAYKGGLRNAYPEQMLAAVLKATLDRNPNLDPASIQDVAVGTVLSELGGSKAARMALNHVGYPISTSLYTVNRACASSLQAINNIANSIVIGTIDVGIGAGMESMTLNYGSKAVPTVLWPELKKSPVNEARDCIMPMGLTSENVASRYNISRADQDAFAAASHAKASKAQQSGLFSAEIVPVSVTNTNPEEGAPLSSGSGRELVRVSQDDGIRHNASTEKMPSLKPVFTETGTSTAGNSSQISDGAAATLMIRRNVAENLGLQSSILGKYVGSSVVGVAPDEMGVGPAIAIPRLLDAAGIGKEDISVWEINEAFASQALYCVRELGLDMERVNPRGGGIALGHPLGATGARMLATLLGEMGGKMGGEVGVLSMCVGTGMGMAGLVIRE